MLKIARESVLQPVCTRSLWKKSFKPSMEHQRRLNPMMKEIVKKEVLKWLTVGFIYAISNSNWVSPVQVVPKKGGVIVARKEKNELISTCTMTGWRVRIDYRKLNKVTRNDHFPILFIDQMLDKLTGHAYYYFLDGYSVIIRLLLHLEIKKRPLSLAHTGLCI